MVRPDHCLHKTKGNALGKRRINKKISKFLLAFEGKIR